MKRFILILNCCLMIGMFNINKSEAQVHININIQPAWGPSGYDYAEFYYIPELNIYYDIMHRMFYYLDRNRWIHTRYLPVAYSHYDFYSLYKVVINNILDPWRYNYNHRHSYHKYCYNYRQVPIYCMSDHRYYHARNNYDIWVEPRYMPGNEGRPKSRSYAMNTHNGRINNNSRSSSANEALRNGRNNRSENIDNRESSDIRSSNRSTTRSNVTSRSSRTETNGSRSANTSRARSSSSNVSTGSNSRNRSSSSSTSTRGNERGDSASTVGRSDSRSSNSRNSEPASTRKENSNRSEKNTSNKK